MNVQCLQAKEIRYKHVSHIFDIQISEMMLTQEQEGVLGFIMANPEGLHVLTGTPGNGKSFFIKYIIQYLQLKGKTILQSGTTKAVARWLNKTTNMVHTTFRIPTLGYLSCISKPSKILDKIKTSDVIIIDEMSMMTSYVLCITEQHLKQATPLTNATPFQNRLVLLVGDLVQLPSICKYTLGRSQGTV